MKINEKNLCVFATTPPYDLEGVLSKRGEVNKAWQKRYFVLKGNLLFYFEKKGEREPTGLIIVEGCTIELCEEETEPYCFQIVFNGNRTYTLSAERQDVMELWMKALTCAGYEYKKLMVAELQRQLEEIEGTQKKYIQEPIQPVAPKPPPRRQNPFNRPAPPPPVFNNASSIANNNVKIGSAAAGTAPAMMTTTTTTAVDGDNFDRSILDTDLGSFTIVSNTQSRQLHQQQLNQQQPHYQQQNTTSISVDTAAVNEILNFSFGTVHEEFKKQFQADRNERQRRKEASEKPLIDI